MDFIIRKADSGADLYSIRTLMREYADWLGLDLGFQGFEEELASLPGKYVEPDGVLLLALSAGTPAGCVALRPLESDIGEVKRLWVRTEFRGRGLGRRLVAAVLRAADRRYELTRLDTLATMEGAIRLYESFGFRPIPAYYHNPLSGVRYFERPAGVWEGSSIRRKD